MAGLRATGDDPLEKLSDREGASSLAEDVQQQLPEPFGIVTVSGEPRR